MGQEQFVLNWKYKDVNKKLTYDIKKCIGCSLCRLICPVDAIELGPIADIAKGTLSDENPKILIDHNKCCYCMLCAIVCPNDAFHENIEPEGQINLEEYPKIGKFFEIDEKMCIQDKNDPICQLCLESRERNQVKNYFKIQNECPTKCFRIKSPIKGEILIKKNRLWKCSPENCKACINLCPTKSFFIPESAEDVVKYGKIACKEDECFYCGACENSCPDKLIVVKRKDIKLEDPKKEGNYPWIQGWVNRIKEILREKLIEGKEQINIPVIEREVEKVKERIIEEIPQLSEEDRKKLSELNEKIQTLLKSKKIRYWIKDKKLDKITKEVRKTLLSEKS